MRLKKILKEEIKQERKKQLAQELEDRLHSDYRYSMENLLFRGSNKRIQENEGFWTVRPIRKDREPRDTSKIVHFLILGVEDALYPNVPSRAESKFAIEGYDSSELNRYGNWKFVCFPEKTASIYSVPKDATSEYFGDIRYRIEDLGGDYKSYPNTDLSDYKATEKFKDYIEIYFDNPYKVDYDDFQSFIENNFQKMQMEYKMMKKDDEVSEEFVRVYGEFFENTFEYFEEMEVGVQEDSKEVLFDGDTYLKIYDVFFEEFFEWRMNGWGLKPEYMR